MLSIFQKTIIFFFSSIFIWTRERFYSAIYFNYISINRQHFSMQNSSQVLQTVVKRFPKRKKFRFERHKIKEWKKKKTSQKKRNKSWYLSCCVGVGGNGKSQLRMQNTWILYISFVSICICFCTIFYIAFRLTINDSDCL